LNIKEIYDIRANSTAKEALNGTTVLNTVALTKGKYSAGDVKEAVECVQLWIKMTV
jgi:dihydropteroate synthase